MVQRRVAVDLTAEFYLQTIDTVFVRHALRGLQQVLTAKRSLRRWRAACDRPARYGRNTIPDS